jgi:hypothetical protein
VTIGPYLILNDKIRILSYSFYTIEIEVKVSLAEGKKFGQKFYWLNEMAKFHLKKITAQIGCEVLCSNL